MKNIQYDGMEQIPGLQDRIRAVLPEIEKEIGNSADRVSLRWSVKFRGLPDDLIVLNLTDDIAGSDNEYLNVLNFDADVSALRKRVRNLHSRILERFRNIQIEKIKRDLEAPVEA